MQKKHEGQWKKGQSGNPSGRPSGQLMELRSKLASHVPEIVEVLAAQAKNGDVAAARLILERVSPAFKPIERTEALSLPAGSLTEKGNAIIDAVAAGLLAPTQGAALVGAIGALARVAEVDELAARVAALEAQHGKS
jgi:hypothetical protein